MSEKNVKEKYVRHGIDGSTKRHNKMRELKAWAIEKYREKNWQSANVAAFDLTEQITEHGKKIGAHLSPANAQRTIAEWFRRSV